MSSSNKICGVITPHILFPFLLSPRPFADLHVAHVGAVDHQSHGSADFVETVFAGCARVDMQQVVNRIVDHLEDMRMPGDEEFGMQRLYLCRCARVVMARVAADMGHQHPHALAFECEEIRVDAACEPSVDVARDGAQGFERRDRVGQFERADVARMPDFVHVLEEFAQRVVECPVGVGYDADAFIALDFDNIPAKKKDALATSKQVFYQDVLLGLFDKNFAEYDLEGYYDGIIDKLGALSNQGNIEYLFEYYRYLAEILKKKCHIGVKIRRAYNANDIDELLKCADVLSELSDDYKEFYKKLCSVWNRENKPFGFEVFEERIGGMLMRFKSCGEKIIKYCRAETERIDELDDEILWYGDENSKGELLSEHFYNNMRVF